MSNEKKTRAFICIDFSEEIIKEITRLQGLLDNKIKFIGKITEPENLHLTLKFLGEIDEGVLEEVEKRLAEIKFKKLDLHLDKIGAFSHRGMPRIVWVKIAGKEVFELQKKIDEALSGLFPREERFMSHATIARVKYIADLKYFFEYLKSLKIKKIKFVADGFKLKTSELRITGPVYKVLEEYRCG